MKIQGAFRRDLIGAGICLALAGAYWIGAIHIHKSSLIGKGVGADALPRGLAVALAALSAILILQTVLQRWKRPLPEDAPATREQLAEARHKHLRAAGMFLIGLAFLLVVGYVGYIPAVFAMICVTAVYSGRPMSWRIAGIAALLTAALYVLFDMVLKIPMPDGIWPQVWRTIAG
ncbi:tripartite tricarboxylate transporter TctB family protein [Dongia deserti]|uniref:tripartite tricarboxylate transporter TctB family protein n=1 Tax=Dongia deserti TaxID=2268030 RepID=UPI000E64DFA9|nr:tripartite tricarboxylate transporter TctB family protein [Dongia deserti]